MAVLVGHDHHRFQPPKIAVGAPILGEVHAGPDKLLGIHFELGLKPLEQREGVGGGAREARDHIALAQRADLLRVRLDDRLAQGNLAVARHDDAASLTNGKNCCAMPERLALHGLRGERHLSYLLHGVGYGAGRETVKMPYRQHLGTEP